MCPLNEKKMVLSPVAAKRARFDGGGGMGGRRSFKALLMEIVRDFFFPELKICPCLCGISLFRCGLKLPWYLF